MNSRNQIADREQFWKNREQYCKNYDKFFENTDPRIFEHDVLDEILDFLENIDLEEHPVQRAKELYKKYLTAR